MRNEVQNALQQQGELFLRVLNQNANNTQKRSDVPWPTFSAKPGENVRAWLYQMEGAFEAHRIADNDKVVNAMLCSASRTRRYSGTRN